LRVAPFHKDVKSMLSKSRNRAMKALFGSAMLLALPLATGCQTGNFGGNIPGYGMISGWWGGPDASKADPNKPPAGFQTPSSKADPNGSSYAGGGGGAARGPRGGYGSQADTGGYPKQGSKQGPSYAAGDRSNPNNWGGSANRQASGSSPAEDVEGDFAGAPAKGYGASRGDRTAPGYDPYGGNSPSNVDETADEPTGRASAYSADARGSSASRNAGGYGNRMISGSDRATKSDMDDGPAGRRGTSSYSARGSRYAEEAGAEEAPVDRSTRSATISDDESEAMTSDETVEANYPKTKGYSSSYTVPANRGAATPATDRRYPATKSTGGEGGATDDDYGMSETEVAGEEPVVEQVAAVESRRYGLSTKAADMLEKSDDDSEFRPGSTGRPGYRKASSVSQAGYSATEPEATASRSSSSRYSE
jgi:hypothetical protein